MDKETHDPQGNVSGLTWKQLEIYATELQQYYREERRLRRELEERNQQLEQRLQELTALNQLFQRHLTERFSLVDSYKWVVQQLQRLAQQANELAYQASSQPIPDLRQSTDTDGDSGYQALEQAS